VTYSAFVVFVTYFAFVVFVTYFAFVVVTCFVADGLLLVVQFEFGFLLFVQSKS
jgi:hypothetical protein